MAARRWTMEQRKQQSEKIRQWQPWINATGARTAEGKARSCRNAFKGGIRPAMQRMARLLRDQSESLDAIASSVRGRV